jgi:transmembrane sensor
MSRTAPTLEAIDAAAARWVARRDAGLSEAEQGQFAQWCAESPLHAEAIARFEGLWSSLGRPRRTGVAPVLQSEMDQLRRQQRRRRTRLGAAAAAGAVLLMAGSWLAVRSTLPGRVTPVAAVAHTTLLAPERRELPDGSQVDLRSGSEIELDFTTARRRILLRRGEAHFVVAKNPDRPFIVSAGGIEVRAVGTVFSVQLGVSQVEVLVTEGRVAVEKPAAGAPRTEADPTTPTLPVDREPLAFVDAGNRLEVEVALQPVAPPEVQPVAQAEMSKRLAWRTPQVEFSGAPLSEVILVLNRYQQTPFVLGDAGLAGVSVSGLFRADDTEVFIGLLRAGFGIAAEPQDGRIVLRKAP